jgi:transcriptional regulator with XRE-family HTH domain
MARAALGWSRHDLGNAAGITGRTVARFEDGEGVQPETVEALRAALVKEGVAFTNGGRRYGVSVLREQG